MNFIDFLFYTGLGGLLVLGFAYVYHFHADEKLSWKSRAFFCIAIFLAVLSIGWAYASVMEGETQAAFTGLICFGGLSVIFSVLARRGMSIPDREIKRQKTEKKSGDGISIEPKRIIAIALLVIFILILPLTLIIREMSSIVFDKNKFSNLLITSIISDDALPKTIKKAVRYQIQFGPDDTILDKRIMLALTGGIDAQEWVALFKLVLPEKTREDLIKQISGSLYTWLDSESVYPEIVIPSGRYISDIEANAENIVPWIYNSLQFPPCPADQLARYDQGELGNDLKALLTCPPPQHLQAKAVPVAAGLLKNEIRSSNPPKQINLTKQMQESATPDQMLAQKSKVNDLCMLARLSWIMPVFFFLIALVLVVRSKTDLVAWIRWPLFVVGLLGMLMAMVFFFPVGLLEQVLSAPPKNIPPPALAIVQNILMPLFHQAGGALIIQMLIPLTIGALLLGYSYRRLMKP